jgi:hypothetical protein
VKVHVAWSVVTLRLTGEVHTERLDPPRLTEKVTLPPSGCPPLAVTVAVTERGWPIATVPLAAGVVVVDGAGAPAEFCR